MYKQSKRRIWMLGLAAAAAVCGVSGGSSASSVPPADAVRVAPIASPEMLSSDKRLDQMISLQATGVSCGELLQKLNLPTLQLHANHSCAELKVQIRLKQRPVRDLMQSLAQLFSGYWQPMGNKQGYTFSQSAVTNLTRQCWWELFLSDRERALNEQRALVLQQIQGKLPLFNISPNSPEPSHITPEAEAEAQSNQGFFRMLPASIQEAIAAQMNEILFLGPGGNRYGTGDTEGAVTFAFDSLPLPVQQYLRKRFTSRIGHDLSDADVEGLTLSVANGGRALIGYATKPNSPYFASNPGQGSAFFLPINTRFEQQVVGLMHPWIVDAVRRMGKDAPDNWKCLAVYQQRRVWPNDACSVPHLGRLTPRKADLLDWVARQADIEFVADYHSRGGAVLSEEEKAMPLPHPLKIELDYQARDLDISWEKQDNAIYLFRNNRWYRDDRLEVPGPLARRWLAAELPPAAGEPQDKQAGETSLRRVKRWMDRRAEFVSSLSVWQLTAGLPYLTAADGDTLSLSLRQGMQRFGPIDQAMPQSPKSPTRTAHYPPAEYPFWGEADYITHNLHLLTLYASLSDENRMALLENRLPLAQLTTEQARQTLYLLPELRVTLSKMPAQNVVMGFSGQVSEDNRNLLVGTVSGRLQIFAARREDAPH